MQYQNEKKKKWNGSWFGQEIIAAINFSKGA